MASEFIENELLTSGAVEAVYGVKKDTLSQGHRHGRINPSRILTDAGGKRHNLWVPEEIQQTWCVGPNPDGLAKVRRHSFIVRDVTVLSDRWVVLVKDWVDKRLGNTRREV